MIKVISNSDSLSTWYLDPGVPTDGDGKSFDNPFVWQLHSSNDNKNFNYTTPTYGNYIYVLLKLTSGTTYNGNIVAKTGPITYQLYDNDDPNTVLKSFYYYDNSTFSFSVDKTGLYIFKCGEEFYNSGSTETLTLNPSPDIISGEAVWKKKEGLAQGDGWNKKTGKVFEYRTLEKANLKHNVFLQGLMYFDTNDFYSFSSPDVKNQTFKNGPIIVQRNLNLGDSEPTLLSGYSDCFCEKRKGYIYIAEAGSYTFSGQADDHGMLKLEDNEAYISWSGTKTYFTVNLEVGYHLIEYYHGEGGGGQITEVYWTTPSNSTATSIPAEVFFYSPKEYKELGGI